MCKPIPPAARRSKVRSRMISNTSSIESPTPGHYFGILYSGTRVGLTLLIAIQLGILTFGLINCYEHLSSWFLLLPLILSFIILLVGWAAVWSADFWITAAFTVAQITISSIGFVAYHHVAPMIGSTIIVLISLGLSTMIYIADSRSRRVHQIL